MATTAWSAASIGIAAGALLVSMLTFLSQRRRDHKDAEIDTRLVAIEESRRGDEIDRREEDARARQIADIRVVTFCMESPGRAGYPDKVSVTIENGGPAEARKLDLAMLESADRALGNGLGSLVEPTGRLGGYKGDSPVGYYEVPWALDPPRPLARLGPSERVTFPFWLRFRTVGNQSFRVKWEDGRGNQVSTPVVLFDSRQD